ncbi:MAG: glycosyltransferase, partial [Candidatus Omnitrophica bacterium]|nr:glycosyltransferase [Candidatus Omnitrophota bacterium]
AFNAEKYISETLDSVFSQTFKNFEVIVVDDGSTDNTGEVVKLYNREVKYIYKKNGGSATARNVGIKAARGEYVAFLDADDLWIENKLEEQLKVLENNTDLVWTYTNVVMFGEENKNILYRPRTARKFLNGDILQHLLLEDFIPSPTPILKRSVFDEIGYFDETLMRSEDWDLWIRIAEKHPVYYTKYPLAMYRSHPFNKSSISDLQVTLKNRVRIIENAVKRAPERLLNLKAKALANVFFGIGKFMLKRGDHSGARGMFFEAMCKNIWDAKFFGYWTGTFFSRKFLKQIIELRKAIKNTMT